MSPHPDGSSGYVSNASAIVGRNFRPSSGFSDLHSSWYFSISTLAILPYSAARLIGMAIGTVSSLYSGRSSPMSSSDRNTVLSATKSPNRFGMIPGLIFLVVLVDVLPLTPVFSMTVVSIFPYFSEKAPLSFHSKPRFRNLDGSSLKYVGRRSSALPAINVPVSSWHLRAAEVKSCIDSPASVSLPFS